MTQKQNTVAIIDYGSGNIRSAAKAFEHIIAENQLDFDVLVTSNADDLSKASHIVLPGQGAFGDCMNGLKAVDSMITELEKAVLKEKKPFLGICVGMQLLANKGYEYGENEGLGWIEGEVVAIQPSDKSLKIPHMGWNLTRFNQGTDAPFLINQQKDGAYFYFVHSFMFESKDRANIYAVADYGGELTAIVAKDNILGVQFHPEKSQEAGLTLLQDFLLWNP